MLFHVLIYGRQDEDQDNAVKIFAGKVLVRLLHHGSWKTQISNTHFYKNRTIVVIESILLQYHIMFSCDSCDLSLCHARYFRSVAAS
jgi:hypothetical protein